VAPAGDRARPEGLGTRRLRRPFRRTVAARPGPLPPGDERPGHLRLRGCSFQSRQARRGRRRRGQHGHRLRASVPQRDRQLSANDRPSTGRASVLAESPAIAGGCGDLRLVRERDPRGRSKKPAVCAAQKMPICTYFNGSDGTRTRDLRRDRPVLVLAAMDGSRRGFPAIPGTSGAWRRVDLRGSAGLRGAVREGRAGSARDDVMPSKTTLVD
jgi:hypothetical protein